LACESGKQYKNKIVVNEAVTDTSPNCWVEDLSDTTTIFPKSGLEELKIIMEALLVTELCLHAPALKEQLVCWRDDGVIHGSGRGQCG